MNTASRRLLPRHLPLIALSSLVLALFSTSALADETRSPRWSKIAQDVREQLEAEGAADVVLLGRRQLLDLPDGYQAFIKKNAGASRSELRASVLAELKSIATKSQPRLRKSLGLASDAGHDHWLLNAISVRLDAEQLATASHLDSVRYIFPAGPLGADKQGPARVQHVVESKVEHAEPFSAEGKEVGWNLRAIHADWAWHELGHAGEGVLVAMYDTGANYIHEDLRGNVWRNWGEAPNDGVDNDGNGFVDDVHGWDFNGNSPELLTTGRRQHGSWTSSLVVGDGSGGRITGVAPRARFLMLRAWGGLHRALLAHEYALSMGADIMNMSFSSPDLRETRAAWRLLSEQATCAGLVLVSGAGNFQRSNEIPEQLRIPEGIPCVIAAGGVNRDLSLPIFVSLGPVEWASVPLYGDHPMPAGLTKPDVCGFPGPNLPLISAKPSGYLPARNGRRGNSFSGPHVAGVAALMLSANPELPAWRVKETLELTGQDIPPKGKDSRTGVGLVDAYMAVKLAKAERKP